MQILEFNSPVELRQEQGQNVLFGHAAVYYDGQDEQNTTYQMPGGIREHIERGAFDQSLAEQDDIVALAHHQHDKILARRSAGTLHLSSDQKGLGFEMRLADTQLAKDLVADIKAGNTRGTSFGFQVRPGGSEMRGDNRVLKNVQLKEISVVNFPAYPGASVAMRCRQQEGETLTEDVVRKWHSRQRLARAKLDVLPNEW